MESTFSPSLSGEKAVKPPLSGFFTLLTSAPHPGGLQRTDAVQDNALLSLALLRHLFGVICHQEEADYSSTCIYYVFFRPVLQICATGREGKIRNVVS